MSSEAVVGILAIFFGGGTIAAIIQGIVSHRKGVRDADVARDQNALQGFRELTESLRGEVERLRTDRDRDSERIDRIEKQIEVERDLRWSAIQYVRVLLAWVSQHLPDVTPPPAPHDLADHIHTPRKDPEQ